MAAKKRRTAREGQYDSVAYRALQATIARNVRRERARHHWTQEEAAHQCDMSTRLYQHVEAGNANLTLTTLARIVEGFGVEPVVLLRSRRQPRRD